MALVATTKADVGHKRIRLGHRDLTADLTVPADDRDATELKVGGADVLLTVDRQAVPAVNALGGQQQGSFGEDARPGSLPTPKPSSPPSWQT